MGGPPRPVFPKRCSTSATCMEVRGRIADAETWLTRAFAAGVTNRPPRPGSLALALGTSRRGAALVPVRRRRGRDQRDDSAGCASLGRQ